MPRPWRPYEIHPRAWRRWEDHAVPFLMTDVIDAVFALPEDARVDGEEFIPVIRLRSTEGTVFGRRFRIVGTQDDEGRWDTIMHVQLVDPPEHP